MEKMEIMLTIAIIIMVAYTLFSFYTVFFRKRRVLFAVDLIYYSVGGLTTAEILNNMYGEKIVIMVWLFYTLEFLVIVKGIYDNKNKRHKNDLK